MATTLLILRATGLLEGHGRSVTAATSLAVLIYAGHNLIASIVAYGGGHWIDRAGPRVSFAAAAVVYVASYLLFAFAPGSWPVLLIAFLLAGTGIGLAETAESSLVARLLQIDCAAVASASSVGCGRWATSAPRPWSGCYGPRSPRWPDSSTPPHGWASRPSPPFAPRRWPTNDAGKLAIPAGAVSALLLL